MSAVLDTAGELPGVADPPRVIAPAASVFADRARRFERLAVGHVLGDWLRFLARLASAQHEALLAFPEVPLPDRAALVAAREYGMPPLSARDWVRDAAWSAALRRLCDRLAPEAPDPARLSLRLVKYMPEAWLESLADQVLAGDFGGHDTALLPFVAAGLEVMWTAMASRLGHGELRPVDVRGLCPACGYRPVSSIVRAAGEPANLRYLHCALCNTEWNLVRVTCAACESTEGIAYQQLIDGGGAVRAETCDGCKSYLKIMYRSKDPEADPVADDLATLSLDMLVDELGYGRSGPNLYFVPGEA
jgi:FdhE protein